MSDAENPAAYQRNLPCAVQAVCSSASHRSGLPSARHHRYFPDTIVAGVLPWGLLVLLVALYSVG